MRVKRLFVPLSNRWKHTGYKSPGFLVVALLFMCFPSFSATLHLSKSGDGSDGLTWGAAYTTLNDALAASASGDHIWVAGDVYNETVKLITGVSLFGGFAGTESAEDFDDRDPVANPSVLDASGLDSNVMIGADDCLLGGFVIRGGYTSKGGGIYCDHVSMAFEDCRIEDNLARTSGGGVYCSGSDVSFKGCVFRENRVISSGLALGGGLFITASRLWMSNCEIVQNDVFAEAVLVTPNPGKLPTSYYASRAYGGGLYVADVTDTELINCLIANNAAYGTQADDLQWRGWGIYLFGSSARISNSTVYQPYDLSYATAGEAIFSADSDLAVENSIVWEGREHVGTRRGTVMVSYSDIQEGFPGEGNINADPRFVDPEGGDFRLRGSSPCIDVGTRVEVFEDLDGNPRPIDVPGRGGSGFNSFDMGCYEFQEGNAPPNADLNGDGQVDSKDLFIFNSQWRENRRQSD